MKLCDIDESKKSLKERLAEGQIIRLKQDLIEHYDFEAVSIEIWKHLSAWYTFDIAIPRFLAYDLR